MGDVTAHFSRREFRCRDECGTADPHPVIYMACEFFRYYLGGPRVDVSCGSRCEDHNRSVGGAEDSQHLEQGDRALYTCAVDLVVRDRTLAEMLEAAQETRVEVVPGEPAWPFRDGGIGLYLYRDRTKHRWVWFVHCDIRQTGPARWARFEGQPMTITRILEEEERLRRAPGWPGC